MPRYRTCGYILRQKRQYKQKEKQKENTVNNIDAYRNNTNLYIYAFLVLLLYQYFCYTFEYVSHCILLCIAISEDITLGE